VHVAPGQDTLDRPLVLARVERPRPAATPVPEITGP
jgi:hypothetical protein